MCVAIAQPKAAATLTIEELERGWQRNPDGGGYAFIADGIIIDYHSLDKDEFILSYLEDHMRYGKDSPFIVHMRIATHGSVTIENTHPFRYALHGDGEIAFMHNGIISAMDPYTAKGDITDTLALANEVLVDMKDTWLENPHLIEYVEDLIDYSKLVFLTTSPLLSSNLYILNGDLGEWVNDIWYSNTSCFAYLPKVQYSYQPDARYAQKRGWDEDDWVWYDADDKPVYISKEDEPFGSWLANRPATRYNAEQLSEASNTELIEYMNHSVECGDACCICTGISTCVCSELCGECYEVYIECECEGQFVSLMNTAIEEGQLYA